MLAVALEPEMPRLDHAGVDGPNRHFVNLLAVDLVEVTDYSKALKLHVKNKSGLETASYVKLLVAVFDEDIVDSFVK